MENGAAKAVMLVIGILLVVIGIALFFGADAGGKLKDQLEQNRLKTKGSYRFVRSPCYSLFLLASAGAVLIAHNPLLLVIPLLYWLEMTVVLKRTEEKWLTELYGQQYTDYCKRVNRFIPWFERKKWEVMVNENEESCCGSCGGCADAWFADSLRRQLVCRGNGFVIGCREQFCGRKAD